MIINKPEETEILPVLIIVYDLKHPPINCTPSQKPFL